jgi:hypothetical protein
MSRLPGTLSFDELLELILDETKEKMIADLLIMAALVGDPEMEATSDTREVKKLVLDAMQARGGPASGAVVAFYEALRTEEEGDRSGSVQHNRHLLTLITPEAYPQTWARAHLRIGTAVLFMEPELRKETLLGAIESLKQSLLVFNAQETPNEYCLAHYNLAFIYESSAMVGDEWESPDYTEAILEHGLAALNLLNQGVEKARDRFAFAKMLIRVIASQPMVARKLLPTLISIAETTLNAKNARRLTQDERKQLKKWLTTFRKLQTGQSQ